MKAKSKALVMIINRNRGSENPLLECKYSSQPKALHTTQEGHAFKTNSKSKNACGATGFSATRPSIAIVKTTPIAAPINAALRPTGFRVRESSIFHSASRVHKHGQVRYTRHHNM